MFTFLTSTLNAVAQFQLISWKSSQYLVALILMFTLSPPPCWGYAQAKSVVKLILQLMPTVKSCFKLNEYKRLSASCQNISQKHLIPWSKQFPCSRAPVRIPIRRLQPVTSEPDVKMSWFLPTAGSYLMISESIGITGTLFQCLAFPCVHGCLHGGQNGNFPPPGNWD